MCKKKPPEKQMDITLVAIVYAVIALVMLCLLFVVAHRWDGSHSKFLSYHLGVMYDLNFRGFLITIFVSALIWPFSILALLWFKFAL